MSFFQDDNRGRNFLTSNAISHTYDESVSFGKLRAGWDTNNLGRPQSQQKVDSAVLAYAERMEDGSKAPAVICRVLANGSLEVLDGCHRLMAASTVNATDFAALIVKCKDDTARKIRIWANTAINGEAVVDPEWSIKTLIEEFVINGTDSIESLAQWVARPVAEMQSRYNALANRGKVQALLESNGGYTPGEIRQGQCDLFIATFGEFLERAPKECARIFRMCRDYKLTNGDTEELFAALKPGKAKVGNPSTTLRSKIREVQQSETWQQRLDITKRNTPQLNVTKAIHSLLTVVKGMKKAKGSWHIEDIRLLEEHHCELIEAARMIRELCDSDLRRALDKKLDCQAFTFKVHEYA
jgi:uncharacterized ParB-like nuclease family protein